MLYTYCFLSPPDHNLVLPQGFRGELTLIEQSAIAAIVEPDLSREELEANDEALVQAVLHHDRVICELFCDLPVLPLRFGTYFRGKEDLLSHLGANAQSYQNKLQEFSGKAEVTLKLTPIPFSENTPASQTTGKAYLKAKKQHYQEKLDYQNQQQAALGEFHQQISQTYPQVIHGKPKEGAERFYLLLNYTEFFVLDEAIEAWEKALQTWKIEVSDPLPPYHFL